MNYARSIFRKMRQMLGSRMGAAREGTDPLQSHADETTRRRVSVHGDHLCGITDVGRTPDHNEDTFHLSDDGRLLIVADGMGGHEAGEVASALAVETVVQTFGTDDPALSDADPQVLESLLRETLKTAHRIVVQAGQDGKTSNNMGATLILAYVHGSQLYTCHVGDVRCYVRTANGVALITRDHSFVGWLVQEGKLTAEEARVHPKKNEILQAIGMLGEIEPEINTRVLEPGDRVLLCSDGLWESLPEVDIRLLLDWEGSMRQLATQFVDRANAAGGSDNITVVLYEHTMQEDLPNELV